MTRTIENGFELTGPIARGDWATVDAHLGAMHEAHPELEPMYRVLAEATRAMKVTRTIAETRAALEPTRRRRPRADDGRAARRPRRAVRGRPRGVRRWSSRACSSTRRSSATRPTSRATRATRQRDAAIAEEAGVDVLFAPAVEEMYPPGYETWVDVEAPRAASKATHRPGHFRGVATVCLKLFNIVRPRRAYFGQKDAQQVEVVRRMVRDLDLDARAPRRSRPSATPTASRSPRATRCSRPRSAQRRARPPARARDRRPGRRAPRCSNGLDVDYVEVAALRPARPRRRRPRRLRPPDRQRPPRQEAS